MKQKKTVVFVMGVCAVGVGAVLLCGRHAKPPATMDEALEIARSAGFVHSSGDSMTVTVSTKPIVDGNLRMDIAVGWEDIVRIYPPHRFIDSPSQKVPGLVRAEWGPFTLYGAEMAVKTLLDATPKTWFP